jgi:enoyl-CoA hydratase/carnithine racemase
VVSTGVRVDRPAPRVLRLRLDRPARRNAIDAAVVAALTEQMSATDADVVILGSTDPRAFCAGADTGIPDADRAAVSDRLYALYEQMVRLPVPILTAAGGHAVGGGAQLLLASDVRFAAADLRVRFVGPGHGLAVGAWGLPSLVGRGRALELCLSMRPVAADEALRIGLVEHVVDDPDAAALELAGSITGLDRAAVGRLKRVALAAAPLRDALAQERRENRDAWSGALSTGRPGPAT